MDREHVLELADGRRLTWAENGADDGTPVLLLHGSPGSRLSRQTEVEALVEHGIRQLSYDRPGYGGSDPAPGRTVRDAVADMAAVLDAAGVDRAAVIGGSGGAPHGLALATLLPERCTVVYCVVGVAPVDAHGLDFFDGMDEKNQQRFRVAAGDRDSAMASFAADFAAMRDRFSGDRSQILGDMKVPAVDREILAQLDDAAMHALAESFRQGVAGFVDDFIALARPWAFDPASATAPVVLMYGEVDVNVPASHGRWLGAHVPHVELRTSSDAGHMMSPQAGFELVVEAARWAAPSHAAVPPVVPCT